MAHNDYLAQVLSALPHGFRGRAPDQLRGDMGGFTSRLQQLPFMQGVPQGMFGQQAPSQSPAQQTPMGGMQSAAPAPMQAGGSPMQSFAASNIQQLGMQRPQGGFGGLGAMGQGYRRQNPLASRPQSSGQSY